MAYDDPSQDEYLDDVDLEQAGAIPMRKGKKKLIRRSGEPDDLLGRVDAFLNAPISKRVEPDAPAPDKKDSSFTDTLSDIGVSAGSGAGSLVKGIGTIGGLVTGDVEGNSIRQLGKEAEDYWNNLKSDKLKNAEKDRSAKVAAADGELQKGWTAVKETLKNPALAATFFSSQLPNLVPGGVVGRALTLGTAAVVGTRAATMLGEAGGIATGAVAQGGDVADQTYDDVRKIPQEVWDANPEYQALVKAPGTTPEQAKVAFALKAAREAGLAGSIISVITNGLLPGGNAIEKFMAGGAKGVGMGGAKGAIKAAAKDGLGEAGSEFIEEGGGQMSGNLAKREIDPNQSIMEGTGENAMMGALGGAGTGSVVGAIHGSHAAVSNSTPEPAADIAAQVKTMLDPSTTKDAVFIAKGNEDAIPADLPKNVVVAERPEGTLLTTNPVKANLFNRKENLSDDDMAKLLGYPETKADAVTGPNPTVIQGKDANGNVVSEALTSDNGKGATQNAVAAQTPAGGSVNQTTPEQVQAQRSQQVAQEPVAPGVDDSAQMANLLADVPTKEDQGAATDSSQSTPDLANPAPNAHEFTNSAPNAAESTNAAPENTTPRPSRVNLENTDQRYEQLTQELQKSINLISDEPVQIDHSSVGIVDTEGPNADPTYGRLAVQLKKALNIDLLVIDAPHGIKDVSGKTVMRWPEGVSLAGSRTIVFNKAAQGRSVLNIIGHELAHQLKAEYPEIWDKLSKVALKRVNKKQASKHARELFNAGEKRTRVIDEEIVSEVVGEQMGQPDYWNEVMANEDESFVHSLMKVISDLLDKFTKALTGSGFITATRDVQAIRAAIKEAFNTWEAQFQQNAKEATNADANSQAAADSSGNGTAERVTEKPSAKEPVVAKQDQAAAAEAKQQKPKVDKGAVVVLKKEFPYAKDAIDRAIAENRLDASEIRKLLKSGYNGKTKPEKETNAKKNLNHDMDLIAARKDYEAKVASGEIKEKNGERLSIEELLAKDKQRKINPQDRDKPELVNNVGKPLHKEYKFSAVAAGDAVIVDSGDLGGLSKEAEGKLIQLDVSPAEFKQAVNDWASLFQNPQKKTVLVSSSAKSMDKMGPFITTKEAQQRLASWEKEAERVGKEHSQYTHNKTIISFFDVSGNMLEPWHKAGFQVIPIDIQGGIDIMDIDPRTFTEDYGVGDVYGIFGFPPCTVFTNTISRLWKQADLDGRTETAKQLVERTMAFIEFFKPRFWMLENPMGRIKDVTGLPDARMIMSHSNFGDPYSKYTQLFGHFDAEKMPLANVKPKGAKTDLSGGKSVNTMNERSETPIDFAYSFFMANNPFTMKSAEQRMQEDYPGAYGAISAAIKAGVPVDQVEEILDGNYDPMDHGSEAVDMLVDAVAERKQAAQPLAPAVQKAKATAEKNAAAAAQPNKKKATGAQRARERLKREDPFLAFLGSHGVNLEERSDTGGQKGRAGVVMVPGYGPIYRKTGQRLDELAQYAVEEGFLTEADINDANDNGGTRKLAEMIRRSLYNKEVIEHAAADPDSHAQQPVDDKLAAEAHSLELDTQGKTAAEVYDMVSGYYGNLDAEMQHVHADSIDQYDAIEQKIDSFVDETTLDLPHINFNFSDALANERLTDDQIDNLFTTSNAPENGSRTQESANRTAGQGAEGGAAQSGLGEGGAGKDFSLNGETESEARQKIAQQEQAQKEAAQADAAAELQAKAERDAKDVNARVQSSVDDFQLGQSADQQLSGQRDMLDGTRSARSPNRSPFSTIVSQLENGPKIVSKQKKVSDLASLGLSEDIMQPVEQFKAGKMDKAELIETIGDIGVTVGQLNGLAQALNLSKKDVGQIASLIAQNNGDTRFARAPDDNRQANRFRDVWFNDDNGLEILYGKGWALDPSKVLDSSADLQPNGVDLGHSAWVEDGNRVILYKVVNPDTKETLGKATLQVDKSGNIVALHDIDITKKNTGLGTDIVRNIVASNEQPIHIIQMVPSALKFWESVGVYGQDHYDNGHIDWRSFRTSERGRKAIMAQASGHPAAQGGIQGAAGPISTDEGTDSGTRFARVATDTPAFKKWFRTSVITDTAGKPAVMFHGTAQDISEFRAKQAGAIFVTDDPKFADGFANTSSYWMRDHLDQVLNPEQKKQATAEATRTLRSTMTGDNLAEHLDILARDPADSPAFRQAAEKFLPSGENVMPVYVRAENPFDFSSNDDINKLAEYEGEVRYTADALHANDIRRIRNGEWEVIESKRVQDALKQLGYDAFYVTEGGRKNLAVYQPQQLKSAIGNNGTFDPQHPDIRFARVPQRTGDRFTIPKETWMNRLQDLFQNNFNRVQKVQDAVVRQGGKLDETNDTYRAQERMMGSTASRIDWFNKFKVAPLLKEIGKSGVDMNDLALYMYALHAKERNAYIRSINPGVVDGSGMSDADAGKLLVQFRTDPKFQQMHGFAKRLQDITKETQKVMIAGGLVDQSIVQAWNNEYSNYIPLKGFENLDEQGNKQGLGRGYDVRGPESRRALGRQSKAGQIIENIVRDHERAIARTEKNKVARAFLKFVRENKDDKLWEVNRVVLKPVFSQSAGMVLHRMEKVEDRERTIVAKDHGVEYHIVITDPRLHQQLVGEKGLFNLEGTNGKIFNVWGSINRNLTKMWTALNPVFTVTNFARDYLTAAMSGMTKMGPKFATKVAGYAFPAMAGIYSAERSSVPVVVGPNGPKNWKEWYQQYQEDGGKAGFYQFSEIEDKARDLHNLFQAAQNASAGGMRALWAKSVAFAHAAEDVIMDANGAIENATRVSSYRAAIEAGKTRAEAASIAKNLTVNFNRRGVLSPSLGSFFLFFNPSVQGTTRIVQAAKDNPVAFGAMTASLVGLGILFGAMNAGDKDDDGVPYWDKDSVPDYEKSKNLIIMQGKGNRIAIPLAYGYGWFVHLGYALADIGRGRNIAEAGAEVLKSMLQHYSPLNTDSPAQLLTPTAFGPVIQQAMNQRGTGNPLRPNDAKMDGTPVPESERYWSASRGSNIQRITEWLNEATGGDHAVAGKISVSPEVVKNYISGYTGGAGTFISDLINGTATTTNLDFHTALEKGEVPFAKQLYKYGNSRGDQMSFMKNSKQALEALNESKLYYDTDKPAILERIEKNRGLADLGASVHAITQAMSAIRKQEIAVRDQHLPARDENEVLKDLDKQKQELWSRWNADFYNLKD